MVGRGLGPPRAGRGWGVGGELLSECDAGEVPGPVLRRGIWEGFGGCRWRKSMNSGRHAAVQGTLGSLP